MTDVRLGPVALAFALAVAAPAVPADDVIVDPARAELSGTATEAQTAMAVKLALLGRGWDLAKDRPGFVEASYRKPDYRMTIAVEFTPRQVTIRHVDSEGLDYEENDDGTRTIHGNYNKWIAGILKDVPIFVDRVIRASR